MVMLVTSFKGFERSHKRRFLWHVALLTTLGDVASMELIESLKIGGFPSILPMGWYVFYFSSGGCH